MSVIRYNIYTKEILAATSNEIAFWQWNSNAASAVLVLTLSGAAWCWWQFLYSHITSVAAERSVWPLRHQVVGHWKHSSQFIWPLWMSLESCRLWCLLLTRCIDCYAQLPTEMGVLWSLYRMAKAIRLCNLLPQQGNPLYCTVARLGSLFPIFYILWTAINYFIYLFWDSSFRSLFWLNH